MNHTDSPQTPATFLAANIRTYAVTGRVITELEASRLRRIADEVERLGESATRINVEAFSPAGVEEAVVSAVRAAIKGADE